MNKLEKIYWRDIGGLSDGWMELADLIKKADKIYNEECVSVGEVIYETTDYIIVSSTFDGDEKWHDASMIMKSVIIRRELI